MLLLLLSLLSVLLLFPDKEVISVDEFVATKIQIQTLFFRIAMEHFLPLVTIV
jgi:hypothetical protein